MGVAIPIPRAGPVTDAEQRLRRLRMVAWLLDRSIPIGGRWRIGLDPIIGLLPGAGDWLGAVLSLYVLYEGARLGMPAPVLMRMGGNVLIESILGSVPIAGDLFDFVWQANARNLALIERHHHPALRPRSLRKVWFALAAFSIVVLALLAVLALLVVRGVLSLFN